MFVQIDDKQRHNRLPGNWFTVVAGFPSYSYGPPFPWTEAIAEASVWTFGASMVPCWRLVGLFQQASPIIDREVLP
jgi:hypothetical protein